MVNMETMSVVWLAWLAWVNFAICSAIGWACLCRVAMMSADSTLVRVRMGYTLLLVAAACSGLSPVLWNEWPGPGQITMALSALYVIGGGAQNWRAGPPPYARTDRAGGLV